MLYTYITTPLDHDFLIFMLVAWVHKRALSRDGEARDWSQTRSKVSSMVVLIKIYRLGWKSNRVASAS